MSRPPDLTWEARKDARRFQRVPTAAHATLVSTALGRIMVPILDLSQGGARLRTAVRCRPGDRFVLRLDGVGPRAVTVAWRREDGASAELGLTFAEPIGWFAVTAAARRNGG